MERSRSSSVEANVETYMLQTVHLSWSVAGGFRRWASAAAGPANRGVRDYGGNAAAVNADGAPRDSPATARLLRRRPAEELAHVLPGALIRRGVVRQGDAVLLAASEGEDPANVCLRGVMSAFGKALYGRYLRPLLRTSMSHHGRKRRGSSQRALGIQRVRVSEGSLNWAAILCSRGRS